MLVNLSEVMTVLGQTKHMEVPLELTHLERMGESYPISKKNLVVLDIGAESERKVHILCRTEVSVLIPCSRCLEDVEVSFEIDYEREFDFREVNGTRNEDLKEATYIQDFDLNVEDLIVEEILLQFPMQTLCREDCKGFCNECGKNLNNGGCQCSKQGRDPRMLAIQDIFKKFGQAEE